MPNKSNRSSADSAPDQRNPGLIIKSANASANTVISPLEYMLRLFGDDEASKEGRKCAAYHAAPFCHSKPSTVDHGGDGTLRHEDALDSLE